MDGDKPYGFRNKRSDIVTSSGQEAKMMEDGTDTTEYTHAWPNRIVYYEFCQTLGELLKILLINIYLTPSASCLMILDYFLCGRYTLYSPWKTDNCTIMQHSYT